MILNIKTHTQPIEIYQDGQLANKAAFRAYKASKTAHRAIRRMHEIIQNARVLIDENRM